MAMISSSVSAFAKLIIQSPKIIATEQVRHLQWCKHWTKRDMKRRKAAKDFAVDRVRLLTLKRNTILPKEIIEDASKEFDEKIPRITALRQLTNRCSVTSRGRGVVVDWRISRFIFRHVSDYNLISGVQRAMW